MIQTVVKTVARTATMIMTASVMATMPVQKATLVGPRRQQQILMVTGVKIQPTKIRMTTMTASTMERIIVQSMRIQLKPIMTATAWATHAIQMMTATASTTGTMTALETPLRRIGLLPWPTTTMATVARIQLVKIRTMTMTGFPMRLMIALPVISVGFQPA